MLTFWQATSKRVSGIASRATANRVMVDDLTSSVESASAGTGIGAFLINARLILSALGANHTLGSARRRRADVVLLTRAYGVIVNLSTLAVRATWRRQTRILMLGLN